MNSFTALIREEAAQQIASPFALIRRAILFIYCSILLTMGPTSRRDDSYSRSLSPPDNNLPYSSRPSDDPQTGRPLRSGKSKSQSQNNKQLTDVSPQQELVSPPIEVRPSYQDYIRQRLPNEQIDTAMGSSSGAASGRTRESRPAENRTTAIPIATSNSYQTTARRNDTVRRGVEHETRSRGGLVSPRVVVVLVFVILTSNALGSIQLMKTDELSSHSPHPPPSHLVDHLRKTFLPHLNLEPASRLLNTLSMTTEGCRPTSDIRVSQVPMQRHERTCLHPIFTIPLPNSISNQFPGFL